eukprot:tig00020802_g13996.t1
MKRVSDLNQSIIRRGWGNEATTERQWVANWPNVNPALLLDQARTREGAAGEEAAYPDADGALWEDADGPRLREGTGPTGGGLRGYADADGDLRAAAPTHTCSERRVPPPCPAAPCPLFVLSL